MREIQRLGENWTEHTLEAKILPERNLIHDLLSGQNGYYLEITHDEFEAFERHCQNKLKRY
jgi:hypothetical protein